MLVAGIQLRVNNRNRNENLKKAEEWILKATRAGARLVCLPEFFSSGNFVSEADPNSFSFAEEDGGYTVQKMSQLAKQLNISLIVPIFERDKEETSKFYNSAIIIDPKSKKIGRYRKQFIPDGAYPEKFYFTRGNLGTPVFRIQNLTFGILICYDRHFFELPRIIAKKGADVLFIPSSTFRSPRIINIWREEIMTIAANNSLYVLGVNTTGYEDRIDQFGLSTAIDPFGNIISTLEEEEGFIIADVSFDILTEAKQSNNVLKNYRSDTLSELMDLYK